MPQGCPEFGSWTPIKGQRRLHQHRNNGLEIVVVTKGDLMWSVDGRAESVPAGSAFFTLPWNQHGGTQLEQPSNELFFVVFELDKPYRQPARQFRFHPRWAISREEAEFASRALIAAPRHSYRSTALLEQLLRELVGNLEHESPANAIYLSGLGKAAIGEMVRIVSGAIPAARPAMPPTRDRVRRFATVELPASCDEAWTLESMAERCELGRTRFAAVLAEITGDRPSVYLNRLRIERACAMLRNAPKRTISEIALDCGFQTSQYFATVFRQFKGCSPESWRNGR